MPGEPRTPVALTDPRQESNRTGPSILNASLAAGVSNGLFTLVTGAVSRNQGDLSRPFLLLLSGSLLPLALTHDGRYFPVARRVVERGPGAIVEEVAR
jgi:hypothetical protein